MPFFWFLVAFIAGAVTPLQAGVNASLRDRLGHPLHATFINFFGGSLLCLVVILIARIPLPSIASAAAAPWWSWLGGLCGVVLVLGSVMAVGHLGFAGLIMGILAGQIACSLFLDHFGILSQHIRELSPSRLAGVGLVVAGIALIQFTGSRSTPADSSPPSPNHAETSP